LRDRPSGMINAHALRQFRANPADRALVLPRVRGTSVRASLASCESFFSLDGNAGATSAAIRICGRGETRAFGIFGLKADCNGPWINLSTSGPPVDFWAAQRAARPRLIKHRRGLNHWRRDARNLPAHWALSPREDNEGSDNAHNIRCGDRPRPCDEWRAGTKSARQRRGRRSPALTASPKVKPSRGSSRRASAMLAA
jgi:hypothetical protein